MKRMTRLTALLLALVMVCSAVPFAASAAETAEEAGIIADTGHSLNLEGAVHINQYAKITGFDGVDVAENGGLLVFKSPVSENEATIENADEVHAGLVKNGSEYMQRTDGIPAKEYADELYLRVYVKDAEGNYVYGPVTPYSVQEYCEGRLEHSDSENMKNLAAAMLHYGTAAQMYFKYNTKNPANANIVENWPAAEWDSGLLTPLKGFTTDVESTGDVQDTGKSLTLVGAIKVNFYFQPVGWTAAGAELLVWDGVSETLTADNASYTVKMVKDGNDWMGTTEEIVAKEMGKTIFAAARFVDTDGGVHYSDVIAYSPEAYAEGRINKSPNANMVELAKRMVIYGEYAAIYFGVSENEPEEKPETDKVEVSADVNVENGAVKDAVSMETETVKATVPSGVAVENGASQLTLSVQSLAETTGDITTGETEERTSLDIHVDGVAADNTTAIVVELGAILAPGLNKGNVSLYHVENGATNAMTQVDNETELDTHNEFHYDPVTGDVSVAMASFSEVAAVVDTTKAWKGEFDYSWYNDVAAPVAEGEPDYVIANADQLAAFGAIVGGMNGQTQDSFAGKTVKLIADVNLGDDEANNDEDKIFYPIGYYNSEYTYEKTETAISSGFMTFEGTFDGNGHTIKNFYQNTWEMKGDNNYYDASLQYYRDGMGLFGKVYGGTVKNLTIRNFSSDGEYTTTGVIAAYADCGATFENIAIFDCNPRVYNIGNGGIVGCVGWYAAEAVDKKVTFTNITVDNSNKISALWGSYDVACGGLVGQYYPTSGQTNSPKNAGIHMENCHVSAQMDVYNDVCGNYQYYAYRYAGMLIGSIRENETIDGHVYPKMDGITANGCTVHFGTWNDYYYCELVDNTTASYTHDHQMSRLDEIKAINGTTITYLDGTKGTVPATGRANYVIVDYTKGHGTENATCYHFLNGKVWTHDMAGEETVNGETVLKEDKQHIYLEFNNLFTGYGWGVTSRGLQNLDGVTNLDVTAGDHEESVEKFEKADTAKDSYNTGMTVTIGELFKAKEQNEVEIDVDNVQVTISPVGETSTAGGTYIANTDDWTQGTLTFSGAGAATITITDYYFCTPTTISVTIEDRQPVEKFDKLFDGNFLYRVGNKNTVALSSLFAAKDGAEIGTVSVTVEAQNGTSASGTYTSNDGTIQFSGTGVVKVTIKDDDKYCIPTELLLEVVDAKNITKAESATANDVVLLNDISGTFVVSNGHTFYGNDFTVKLPTDSVKEKGNGFTGYISIGAAQDSGSANGGNLDNVRIVGPVYPEMYIYRDQAEITDKNDPDYSNSGNMRYFVNSVIVYGGNCNISNSYISGSRTALCLRGGNNVVIENTTLSGGAYANLQICAGSSVTLRNLTTVQVDVDDSYGKGKKAHGLGIAVDSDVVDIYIEGDLQQYNWLNQTQWNSIVPSTYQSQFPKFFTNRDFSKHWHYLNQGEDPYVNLAFIFACNWDTNKIHDNRTEVNYDTTAAVIAQVSGGVYSKVNTNGGNAITAAHLADPGYTSPGFNAVAPTLNFDNTSNHDEDDVNDANDTYCVYNESTGILKIGVSGDSKTLDLSKVTVTKNGTELGYTAYLNDTQISGNSVTIKTADGAKQTLCFKATSNDAGYDKDGKPIEGSIEYTWNITVEIAVLSFPAPVWNMGGDYQFDTTNCYYAYYATSNGYGEAVPIYEGIKVNYYNKDGKLEELDFSGTTTHPTGSNNSNANAFTYTLADGSTLTMKFYSGWKSGATTHQFTTYNKKVYIYPQSLDNDNYIRAKTTNQDFDVKISYTFTDPNGQSISQTMQWYNAKANNGKVTQVQWKDFDSTNGKKPSTCFTADTFITLMDGSQKRIDEMVHGEKILAWDFFTGKTVVADISLLVNHGEDLYQIANLEFSDGAVLRIIGDHGLFDYELNKFVYITVDNMQDWVGHRFVRMNPNGTYDVVTLERAYETEEWTGAYSITSAGTSNAIASGMLTVAPPDDFYNWIEMGEKLRYDAEKFAEDVQTYGLYTYDVFADYVSYEQFVEFNGAYLKIPVEKGIFTFEYILELIELYGSYMPQ